MGRVRRRLKLAEGEGCCFSFAFGVVTRMSSRTRGFVCDDASVVENYKKACEITTNDE